jgi:hypothetical protein
MSEDKRKGRKIASLIKSSFPENIKEFSSTSALPYDGK